MLVKLEAAESALKATPSASAQGGVAPGHEPIFEPLLALGVPVDEPDPTGLTPLMREIADPLRQKFEARTRLDWFLNHGANPTPSTPDESLSLAAWARRHHPFPKLDHCWRQLESAAQLWELDQITPEIPAPPSSRGQRRMALESGPMFMRSAVWTRGGARRLPRR